MRLALGSLLAQALALGPDSEGCDSEFWIWSRGILAGPSLPGEEDLGAVLRREAEVASSDNAGCRPGRFTLSVWQLVHSNATVRAWHLRKKFGVELVELPWAPLRAWRAFRALAELRRRALQDPKHLHPRLDSSGEPPEKLVSAVEPGGRLAGLLPWAAQALSADRAEAPESPAVAAALWILASKGTPQEAEELLAEGEQHAKTWALSKAWPLHHFLLERWPLLELLRHLEAPVYKWTLAGGDPREPQCRAKEPYAPSVLSAGLESQRVEAVVVYGRKDRVEILCRYLVRNLRINGGVIDKVHFVVHAAMREDMDYLQELISAHAPHFAYPAVTGRRLAKFYSVCTDPETIYLKMDDDMVYLADEAVPEMVRERMRNRCGLVSANVINHAILSAVHQDIGAVRNFFPLTSEDTLQRPWIRNDEVLPIMAIEKKSQSQCVWSTWECGAWMHESFLSRLEDGTACAYDFGWHDFHASGHGTFDGDRFLPLPHTRWSINLIAFKAEDVADAVPEDLAEDDEKELSVVHPARLEKRSCAVGSALAAHFSYSRQEDGLVEYTNLLERYRQLSSALAP